MTKRFYSGSRSGSRTMGEAARLKRLEIEKGGKLPMTSQERYKRIMKKKLEESKAQARSATPFSIPGAKPLERKMSRTTEQAMRMIAQRKAMKEEKELRKMVVVKSQLFSDAGRIDKKGQIYDLGNNLTMKVDTKTGKIKTQGGWLIGKYNPKKKYQTNMIITDALKKHGAYFIQQKRLQMLAEQQRMLELQGQGSVWGGGGLASQQFLQQHYGETDSYGRPKPETIHGRTGAAANVSAWGAMSNNVHGTYIDNAWGGMADNVWGGVESNIWGGFGGSSWGNGITNWSKRGLRIWGSGTEGQRNYLKPLGALFVGFLGIGTNRGLGRLFGGGQGRTGGRSR